jgi:hypothetical protein
MQEDNSQQEEDNSQQDEPHNDSPISPEFQKEVGALLAEATLPELEFAASEVADMMKKLNSSQKKSGLMTDNFSKEGMPQD